MELLTSDGEVLTLGERSWKKRITVSRTLLAK